MRIVIGENYNDKGEVISRMGLDFSDAMDTEDDKALIGMLTRLNGDPLALENAGYLVKHQHNGESEPVSRWNRLVNYLAKNDVPEILKRLELKEHVEQPPQPAE